MSEPKFKPGDKIVYISGSADSVTDDRGVVVELVERPVGRETVKVIDPESRRKRFILVDVYGRVDGGFRVLMPGQEFPVFVAEADTRPGRERRTGLFYRCRMNHPDSGHDESEADGTELFTEPQLIRLGDPIPDWCRNVKVPEQSA